MNFFLVSLGLLTKNNRFHIYCILIFFLGRLLHDRNLPEEVPVRTLNVLACAALKDDVILLLHQDRREHIIMNYAHDVDRLPIEQQKALALFVSYLLSFS